MKKRYQGSKDRNHDAIVADFESLGCTVAGLIDTGIPGWPDLVVGCVGVDHLVEVKNPETRYGQAGLTPEQSAFAASWRGGKVEVAETTADVIDMVQKWRRR
jgi:hypothetical protein